MYGTIISGIYIFFFVKKSHKTIDFICNSIAVTVYL